MFTSMFSREERSAQAAQAAPKGAAALGPSAHVDTFARDNLPPAEQWPDLLLDRPEFQYPEYLNAAVELTDRMVEKGFGDNTALIGNGRRRTYKELTDWSNRLAHALVEDFGVKPGNRVLLRSGNNPAMVAAWLAVTKAGAVAVNTMPLLRAGELAKIVDKAEVSPGALRQPHRRRAGGLRQGQPLPQEGDQLRRHRQPRRRARPRGAEQVRQVRRRARPGATTWRCWASPPAPPASPRAPCTSTATC